MDILTLTTVHIWKRNMRRNKREHFITESIHQEDITTLNVYVPDNRTSKYRKKNLSKLKWSIKRLAPKSSLSLLPGGYGGLHVKKNLGCPHWYFRIPSNLTAPAPFPPKLKITYPSVPKVSFLPRTLSLWKILNSTD